MYIVWKGQNGQCSYSLLSFSSTDIRYEREKTALWYRGWKLQPSFLLLFPPFYEQSFSFPQLFCLGYLLHQSTTIFTTNYCFAYFILKDKPFIKVIKSQESTSSIGRTIFRWTISDLLLFNDVSITKAASPLEDCFDKWDQLLFSSIWILHSQKINGKIFTNPHWCDFNH